MQCACVCVCRCVCVGVSVRFFLNLNIFGSSKANLTTIVDYRDCSEKLDLILTKKSKLRNLNFLAKLFNIFDFLHNYEW